jgi:hypothetical protein
VPVYCGPDPAAAFDLVCDLMMTKDLIAGLDGRRRSWRCRGCARRLPLTTRRGRPVRLTSLDRDSPPGAVISRTAVGRLASGT